MRKIAIQDANILIDLVNIGLFSHCLALGYEFSTTQLIFKIELNESQVAVIQVHMLAPAIIIMLCGKSITHPYKRPRTMIVIAQDE